MRSSRGDPTWVPASEIRGEGLFFEFNEDAVRSWCEKVKDTDQEFFEALFGELVGKPRGDLLAGLDRHLSRLGVDQILRRFHAAEALGKGLRVAVLAAR